MLGPRSLAPVATPGRAGRIEVLDSVRGLAAFVVVLHHTLLLLPHFAEHSVARRHPRAGSVLEWLLLDTPLGLAWAGREAVMLFFVLSGFVLALPWVNGRPPGYMAFLVRRFCRIYLPFAAAILLAAGLATGVSTFHLPGLSLWFNEGNWNRAVSGGALLSHLAMVEERDGFFLNNVMWSLVWELRISAIFPLLLLPMLRWGTTGAAAAIAVLTAASATADLAGAARDAARAPAYAAFFLLGALLALHARSLRRRLATRTRWVPYGLLVLGLLAMWCSWPLDEIERDRVAALGAALVIMAALAPGPVEAWLRARPFVWLGRVSYSLYLVHLPVILTTVYLLHDRLRFSAVMVVALLATLPVAVLFHAAVEQPANRLGRLLTDRSGRAHLGRVGFRGTVRHGGPGGD